MAERTYLYGYGTGPWGASTTRRTKAYILSQPQFKMVHPEVMRRLFALADFVIDSGRDYGFGSGGRSVYEQYNLFKSRYRRVAAGQPYTLFWNGSPLWQSEAGNYLHVSGADAAPPGRSYHEVTTKGGNGYALACDMLGDHAFANRYSEIYGLKDLHDVNNEPWHYQPIEVPTARSRYINQFENPVPWPIPGTIPPVPPDMSNFGITDPVRIFDNRESEPVNMHNGHKGPFSTVRVSGHGYTPVDASGLILTVTGIGTEAGFFTFWSGGGALPVASNLNVLPGQIQNNMIWVPVTNKQFSVFSLRPLNHLLIDQVGWYWT